MPILSLHDIFIWVQNFISACGVFIILFGIIYALLLVLYNLGKGLLFKDNNLINSIRLRLGKIIILGLEFIIAADLIGTTTAPDYYTVGILAIIVAIRTVLSYTLNKEIESLSKEQRLTQ